MSLKSSAYKVDAKPFSKKIEIPSSKSYANRALIIGALRGNNFKIENLSSSTDVVNLIKCLKAIGLEIKYEGSTAVFKNSFPECEIKSDLPVILETGDGGTTNRFLIALLSLGSNRYQLIPSEKMADRPIEDLLSPLRNLDVEVSYSDSKKYWIEIKGPIKPNGKKLEIDCRKSTQFASALKLLTTKLNLNLSTVNIQSSELYLEMTDYVLGDVVEKNFFKVPVDFSSLSYPLVLAAVEENNSVTISNCFNRDLLQADSLLIEILKEIGVHLKFNENGLEVIGKKIEKGFVVDVSKCPDLAMSLSFLASKINTKSVLTNLKVLIHKESNRLQGILDILNLFNIQFNYNFEKDILEIVGSHSTLEQKSVSTERDHRMVMMGYLFLRTNTGGEIFNIECINKSFPHFIELID